MNKSTLTTTDKTFPYEIVVPWHSEQSAIWWNETCAMVLEVFGLPGHRFIYRPHLDYMIFEFESKKDEQLCRILLSERL